MEYFPQETPLPCTQAYKVKTEKVEPRAHLKHSCRCSWARSWFLLDHTFQGVAVIEAMFDISPASAGLLKWARRSNFVVLYSGFERDMGNAA